MREQRRRRIFSRSWGGIRLWNAVAAGREGDCWELRERLAEAEKKRRFFAVRKQRWQGRLPGAGSSENGSWKRRRREDIFAAVRKRRLAVREQRRGRIFSRFWGGIRLWNADRLEQVSTSQKTRLWVELHCAGSRCLQPEDASVASKAALSRWLGSAARGVALISGQGRVPLLAVSCR